jgi:RES domain-containing protein
MSVFIWRIGTATLDYTADDLSGTGAKITGGRWNRPRIAFTYAAESIALASLETLVNLGAQSLPFNRYLVRMEIPEDVFGRVKFEDAAPDASRIGWDALPAGKVSIDFGSNWAASETSAILDLPSVVIPEERN